jgi:uncharacterized protein with PIN domain
VVRRCDLWNVSRPFSRCTECNGCIEAVDKQAVAAQLEPETLASFDQFWRCPGCGRVYWKGSHYQRLQRRVAAALDPAGQHVDLSGATPR